MGAQPGGNFLPAEPGQSLVGASGALRRVRGGASPGVLLPPCYRGDRAQPGGENESPLSLRNGDRESQLWQDNASRPAKHRQQTDRQTGMNASQPSTNRQTDRQTGPTSARLWGSTAEASPESWSKQPGRKTERSQVWRHGFQTYLLESETLKNRRKQRTRRTGRKIKQTRRD